MRPLHRLEFKLFLVASLSVWPGCSNDPPAVESTGTVAPEAARTTPRDAPTPVEPAGGGTGHEPTVYERQKPVAAEPDAPAPQRDAAPSPVRVPEVVLTASHEALCRVRVGQEIPRLALPDAEGETHDVASLLGENLTVLCFWKGDRVLARAELADLGPDIAVPYSGRGVAVVGIGVDESAESVREVVSEAGATFPNLVDGEAALFTEVASDRLERLPRTYLLDDQGNVLWFDIEYSCSTRRELRQAVEAVLAARGEP